MIDILKKHLASGDEKMDLKEFIFFAQCGETNYVERKSIALLDETKRRVLKEKLSQEISAFANFGNGVIIFGVDNKGKLEEGVADTRGEGTLREWLSNLVFTSVSPNLRDFVVKRVQQQSDKYFFAIIIGESFQAPHQALYGKFSNKYYSRIDNQCQVIDGILVKDIFYRQKNARVVPFDLEIKLNDASRLVFGFSLINDSLIPADKLIALLEVKTNTFFDVKFKNHQYCQDGFWFSDKQVRISWDVIYPRIGEKIPQIIELEQNSPFQFTITIVAKNMLAKIYSYNFDGQVIKSL